MKPLALLTVTLTIIANIYGAGHTAIVTIEEVENIVIKEDAVTIRGTGMVRLRVQTEEPHGDGQLFGQPSQTVHALTEPDATFVIVPYFSDPSLKGVPSGGHTAEDLKRFSDEWWKPLIRSARTVRVGDPVTISYQASETRINGFYISKIVGAGMLTRDVSEKPSLSEEDASAIRTVMDASMKPGSGWNDGVLPNEHWPEAIKTLNPVKVYSHRANVVIVLNATDQAETGLYVPVSISSYDPQGTNREWIFQPDAGGIFRYTRDLASE